VPEGISLLVYDSDHHEKPEEKKELLGRAWVRIENKKRKFRSKTFTNFQKIKFLLKPRMEKLMISSTRSQDGRILSMTLLMNTKEKSWFLML